MKRRTPIPNDDNGWISCWCYETHSQVNIKGAINRDSIAQVLMVEKCSREATCNQVFSSGCLIGKRREGKICNKKENRKQW